jgi:uncharacterized repeat protein (TIGR01451 family)
MKTIKYFLIALTLFSFAPLKAQVWTQVGNGLTNNTNSVNVDDVRSTTSDGKVYTAHLRGGLLFIKYWDGLTWTSLPAYNFNGITSIHDIAVNQGEVFVSYTRVPSGSNVGRWDGSQWSTVFSLSATGVVRDMHVDGNKVYMVGSFNDTANNIEQAAYFSGNNWVSLKTPAIGAYLRDLTSVNKVGGSVIIGGNAGEDTVPLLSLDTNLLTWNSNKYFITGYSQGTNTAVDIFTVNQQSYYLEFSPNRGTLGLFEIQGDSVTLINNHLPSSSLGTSPNFIKGAARDSAYYLVLSSPTTAVASLYNIQGSSITVLSNAFLPSTPASFTSLNNALYLFTRGPVANTGLYPNLINFAYTSTQNFARVRGKAFADANTNCAFDGGERKLPGTLLSFSGGGTTFQTLTDTAGNYSELLPSGTYTVTIVPNLLQIYSHLTSTCNVASSISLGTNQNFQQDIPFVHNGNIDARVNIESHPTHALFGFTQLYDMVIQNPGIAVNGLITAELTLPPTMTLISAQPQSTSVTGNTYTFTFNSLQMFEEKRVRMQIRTDTMGNNLGDTLCLYTRLNGIQGDVHIQDNYDSLCLEVRGAYDPNDKTPSATQILPGTNKIDYRIRFQNTGNSPAVKVTVVDTLDLTLPITAIIMNSASHPYSISVQNNILIWEFNNIMLPDSATDPLGSQGYISFSAGLNPALGLGDSILNDAEIYFDYQKPVHTNTAKTLIIDNIGEKEYPLNYLVDVYPNPTNHKLHVLWKGAEPQSFSLLDIQGKSICVFEVTPNVPFELDLQQLSLGMYFIKSGQTAHKVIVQ